jgi:2',3'-cyclic-nucleotide 2'-phosphodiesterase (5'-nucleotidase family)
MKLILLWSLFLAFAALPADSQATLTIYYSASLNGNLDGCTCEMNPVAGLVKRAAFLRSAAPGGPVLLLDAGDILDERPDPELAGQILEVYRELGYHAVAAGDQELAAGAAALSAYKSNFPLICHNLRLAGGRSDLFTREPLLVETGGLRIAVLALLDPSATGTGPYPEVAGMRVSEPVSAARTILRGGWKERVDLTVMLYHGPLRGVLQILSSCPGIDLAIFAHEGRLVAPQMVGRTLLASPGEEGNHLGILSLRLGSRGIEDFRSETRFFSFEKDADDPQVRRRIEAYRQKQRSRR